MKVEALAKDRKGSARFTGTEGLNRNTIMKKIFNTPIFIFLFTGAILFIAYQIIIPSKTYTITVTQQTMDALIKADEELSQIPITEERKQSIIEEYIDEEVLIQEAFKRNLHKTDYRVRKQLLNLMRSSLTEIIPEPSMAQLRAYFDENKDKFTSEEALTYEFVFFEFNSNQLPVNEEVFLVTLNKSENPLIFSDFSPIGNRSGKANFRRVAQDHGKEAAELIFSTQSYKWTGPVNVTKGIIYFRLIERHEPEVAKFEAIERYLRDDYYLTKSRELQQKKIDELREKYEIVMEE